MRESETSEVRQLRPFSALHCPSFFMHSGKFWKTSLFWAWYIPLVYLAERGSSKPTHQCHGHEVTNQLCCTLVYMFSVSPPGHVCHPF